MKFAGKFITDNEERKMIKEFYKTSNSFVKVFKEELNRAEDIEDIIKMNCASLARVLKHLNCKNAEKNLGPVNVKKILSLGLVAQDKLNNDYNKYSPSQVDEVIIQEERNYLGFDLTDEELKLVMTAINTINKNLIALNKINAKYNRGVVDLDEIIFSGALSQEFFDWEYSRIKKAENIYNDSKDNSPEIE